MLVDNMLLMAVASHLCLPQAKRPATPPRLSSREGMLKQAIGKGSCSRREAGSEKGETGGNQRYLATS